MEAQVDWFLPACWPRRRGGGGRRRDGPTETPLSRWHSQWQVSWHRGIMIDTSFYAMRYAGMSAYHAPGHSLLNARAAAPPSQCSTEHRHEPATREGGRVLLGVFGPSCLRPAPSLAGSYRRGGYRRGRWPGRRRSASGRQVKKKEQRQARRSMRPAVFGNLPGSELAGRPCTLPNAVTVA